MRCFIKLLQFWKDMLADAFNAVPNEYSEFICRNRLTITEYFKVVCKLGEDLEDMFGLVQDFFIIFVFFLSKWKWIYTDLTLSLLFHIMRLFTNFKFGEPCSVRYKFFLFCYFLFSSPIRTLSLSILILYSYSYSTLWGTSWTLNLECMFSEVQDFFVVIFYFPLQTKIYLYWSHTYCDSTLRGIIRTLNLDRHVQRGTRLFFCNFLFFSPNKILSILISYSYFFNLTLWSTTRTLNNIQDIFYFS